MGNCDSQPESETATEKPSTRSFFDKQQHARKLLPSFQPHDYYLKAIKGQHYQRLVSECIRKKRLWTDPLFPAEDGSVYLSGRAPYRVQWLRPADILDHSVTPLFYVGGPGRFDLVQGELGDCWLLAAAAAVSERQELVDRIIPDHGRYTVRGGFELLDGYCGIFRFRFYHFGEWVQVCVDDRLPTFNGRLLMVQSSDPREFWGALLEKAYAKLFGCYEALKGGVCGDALADLTGGLIESYRLKRSAPVGLGDLLYRATKRGSLICTGIWGDANNNQVLPNGLVTGHAYTVSGVEKLLVSSSDVLYLVRIRNPWGARVEWNGRWSDVSHTWQYLRPDVRRRLQERNALDGEFWMDANDFVSLFDDVDVCHLTVDHLDEYDRMKGWRLSVVHGVWNSRTAGGRTKYKDTFALNPQYAVLFADCGDDGGDADAVVELTQKWRRKTRAANLNIGFVVFQMDPSDTLPLNESFFTSRRRAGAVDFYTNLRSVSKRLRVSPGRYVIVPTTWLPGEEGEFMLRVWSETRHEPSWPIRHMDSPREISAAPIEEADKMETHNNLDASHNIVDSGIGDTLQEDADGREESKGMAVLVRDRSASTSSSFSCDQQHNAVTQELTVTQLHQDTSNETGFSSGTIIENGAPNADGNYRTVRELTLKRDNEHRATGHELTANNERESMAKSDSGNHETVQGLIADSDSEQPGTMDELVEKCDSGSAVAAQPIVEDGDTSTNGKSVIRKLDPFICEEAAKYFRAVTAANGGSSEDMVLSAYELQTGLNRLYIDSHCYRFNINCCKALVALYEDSPLESRFHWRNFYHLYQSLELWGRVFEQYDCRHKACLDSDQFTAALTALGYEHILSLGCSSHDGKIANEDFVFLFGGEDGKLTFSSLVHAVAKLRRTNDGLTKFREKGRDNVRMSKTNFVSYALKP